jgi:hypothetical protein
MSDVSVQVLKVVGGIAGIGGIALGIVYFLLQDTIKVLLNRILRELTQRHSFFVVMTLIILVFLVGMMGLGIWAFVTVQSTNSGLMTKSVQLETMLGVNQKALDDLSTQLDQARQQFMDVTEKVTKQRFPGIEYLETVASADLRQRQRVDPAIRDKVQISPVKWKVESQVVKVSDSLETVSTAYGQTGLKPTFYCRTHRFTERENHDPPPVGCEALRRWVLDIDVSGEPTFRPFLIEHGMTAWNSFQGETSDWAAHAVQFPTRRVRFRVDFPPDKPFKTFRLCIYPIRPNAPREIHYPKPGEVETDTEKRWINWHINEPRLAHYYRIDWEW